MTRGEPSENHMFFRNVCSALLRLLALGIFLGAHYLLNLALAKVAPARLTGALAVAQGVIFVVFLLIYGFLAWDMLAVFIPRWKIASYPTEGTVKEEKSNRQPAPESNLVIGAEDEQ